MDPVEEVEHIPWSQLLEEHRAATPWLVYVAAGVVAAAALGVIGARALRGPASPEVVEVPAASTTLPAREQPGPPTLPAPPYSEADLMAAYPADALAAVARAEWYVTDYFTRDGDEAGEGPPTAVEWARAVEVAGSADSFRVTVAFRNVTGTGSGWVRGPARAVTVTVAGSSTIIDLPEPAALPATRVETPVPGNLDPPTAVVGAAFEAASAWGSDPVLLGADRRDGGGWRIVLEVHDDEGRGWQLAVNLNDDGTPVG